MKNITFFVEDKPGQFASIGEALGNAGINIEGICGFPGNGKGFIHVLVEDASKARQAFEAAKMQVHSERDVLVLDIKDQPGEFAKMCRKIANAGVNIDLCYLATQTRLVLGVNDITKAKTALG
jgi:hypothetical protein